MSYKQKTNADREAIFGPASSTSHPGRSSTTTAGSSYKTTVSESRAALFGNGSPATSSNGGRRTASSVSGQHENLSTAAAQNSSISNPSNDDTGKMPMRNIPSIRGRTNITTTLSGAAKVAKMKEAEEYRQKAKAAMEKTFFSRPDPIVASSYYKRAAEAYKLCGENRLERLHRIASGDLNMRQDSYVNAASDYCRAAELSACSDESTARKQKEVNQLYKNAAEAWIAAGERSKAAECYTKAAFGMRIDKEETEILDKPTHTALDEAVQFHLPDILNRMALHRMTESSTFLSSTKDLLKEDKRNAPTVEQQKEHAREEIAKSAYAHENVQQIMRVFVKSGDYRSGLYAAGAVTALLEESGFATVSLFKAYLTETILQLAMGDIVAAEKTFMDVHLQNTSYLSSRECELAEELIRSIKSFDQDSLEKLKKSRVLANVDPVIRELVQSLKVSGKARSKIALEKVAAVAATASTVATARISEIGNALSSPYVATENHLPAASSSPSDEHVDANLDGEALQQSIAANYDEMENLMGHMGLDSDQEIVDEDSDDDIDLR